MTYHQLCIKQSCAAIVGPESKGMGGTERERQAWQFYIGEAEGQYIYMQIRNRNAEFSHLPGCRCAVKPDSAALWGICSSAFCYQKCVFCDSTFQSFFQYFKQAALQMHFLHDHNQKKWVKDNMWNSQETWRQHTAQNLQRFLPMPRPLSPWLPDIAASSPNQILGGSFHLFDIPLDARVTVVEVLSKQQYLSWQQQLP